MLFMELVGAMVGAGIASGRETATFFARYGLLGYPGVGLAMLVMVFIADTRMPRRWKDRWPEALWKLLQEAMLIVTGAAMLSGAGHVASLMLPIGPRWMAMALIYAGAIFTGVRIRSGMKWVGRMLLITMGGVFALGFSLPPAQGCAVYADHSWWGAFLHAVTYGGFNAALLWPVLAGARDRTQQCTAKTLIHACGFVGLVLCVSNALLLRHSALLGEMMPMLGMLKQAGTAGYWLGAGSLSLAILTTLLACIRNVRYRMSLVLLGCLALFPFDGLVDHLYPVIGSACLILLVTAKFVNCVSPPFISGKAML